MLLWPLHKLTLHVISSLELEIFRENELSWKAFVEVDLCINLS